MPLCPRLPRAGQDDPPALGSLRNPWEGLLQPQTPAGPLGSRASTSWAAQALPTALRLPPVPSSDSLLCKGSCFGLGFRILRLWSLKKLTGELKIELLLGRNSMYPKWPPENSFPKWNLGFLSWCHLDKNWLLQVMRSSWTPDGGRCRECPEFC